LDTLQSRGSVRIVRRNSEKSGIDALRGE